MSATTIHANGFEFDVTVAGPDSAELVLLLHGFPQTRQMWRRQLDALTGTGYRVVAPDLRGISPGARPRGVDRYTLQLLCEDVLALQAACGAERCHLVGHDWGGVLAWYLGANEPDRFFTLTAVSVPHPGAWQDALADPRSDQRQRSGYIELFGRPDAADLLLADHGARFRQLFEHSGLPAQLAAPYVDAYRDRARLDAFLNWYRANDLREGEPPGPVECPTLFVWGAEDLAFAADACNRTDHYVRGRYHGVMLHNATHWLPEQAPGALNALLCNHLQGKL